jgi:hypothetical protein
VAALCRPAQKESKRSIGHVVFVLILRGVGLCRPAQKESKRGLGHVVFVLMRIFPKRTGLTVLSLSHGTVPKKMQSQSLPADAHTEPDNDNLDHFQRRQA